MLFEGMYIVFTAKDGPLASTYTRAVADRAVWNLKVLYPGDRVWVMEGSVTEVKTKGLEVLASLEDAEIATAYRVTYTGLDCADTHLRQTLRGLIAMRCMGNERASQGEAFSLELAHAHAKFAREAQTANHHVALPKDIGV